LLHALASLVSAQSIEDVVVRGIFIHFFLCQWPLMFLCIV
jgi:hypothetical protein